MVFQFPPQVKPCSVKQLVTQIIFIYFGRRIQALSAYIISLAAGRPFFAVGIGYIGLYSGFISTASP